MLVTISGVKFAVVKSAKKITLRRWVFRFYRLEEFWCHKADMAQAPSAAFLLWDKDKASFHLQKVLTCLQKYSVANLQRFLD